MYLIGVSIQRVKYITETQWDGKAISELSKKAYGNLEDWRNWPL